MEPWATTFEKNIFNATLKLETKWWKKNHISQTTNILPNFVQFRKKKRFGTHVIQYFCPEKMWTFFSEDLDKRCTVCRRVTSTQHIQMSSTSHFTISKWSVGTQISKNVIYDPSVYIYVYVYILNIPTYINNLEMLKNKYLIRKLKTYYLELEF